MRTRIKFALWGALLTLGYAGTAPSQVVISEFMAKNDDTIMDGDGAYSDWIELYNLGDATVDLTGWHLSDDTNNLAKWTFPSTSLASGDHLVVFASGQKVGDYVDGSNYLHTTFKLSGDGESVVLTQPDGTTIEHAFLDYPEQDDDISYGLAQDSSYSYLVVEEQDATAIPGTAEPSSGWNTTAFDDTGWTSGQTGVGFENVSGNTGPGGRPPRPGETETDPVYTDLIHLDLGNMSGQTESAYIRIGFTLEGTEDISQLSMRMKYDDGFVAYVNGVQVAAANAPASPTHASAATTEHDGTTYEDFSIFHAGGFLRAGDNVLAIHGLNTANDTTDFFISPILTGITAGDLQTNAVMYYSTPTPGSDNVSGVLGYVGDTSFSVDRGFYTHAFEVEIACTTDGAEVFYTVDGTTPAPNNGTLYTGAVPIDHTTVLRAAAYRSGYQPSNVDTQTYVFLDDIVAQGIDASSLAPPFPSSSVNGQSFDYGMDPDITGSSTYGGLLQDALLDIPSISIVTDPDHLFDAGHGIYVNPESDGAAWERETSVELIHPDGTEGFQINGGIRIRGGVSRSTRNPKHSFRLFFRSEYGTSRLNYNLFGDEGADSYKRIDLRTGQNNSWQFMNAPYATWLYDIFTRDTHRDMAQGYTRGRYYHLYLNGMYWGLYQTEERPDSRFGASYYGGDNDDYDAVKADGDTGIMYASDGTRDTYNDLWSAVSAGVASDTAYFALQGKNADGTPNRGYPRLVDVDNLIAYMLTVFYTSNRDSPIGPPNQYRQPRNLNCVFNRENPDGFKFIAHDNEHSLEVQYGVNANRVSANLDSSFSQQDYFTPWWLHLQLMNNEEYRLHFADLVHEYFFNGGVLTASAAARRLEDRRDEIAVAVIGESARWGDSLGSSPYTQAHWSTAVGNILNNFINAGRTEIVFGQIEARGWYPSVEAPTFSQHGGGIGSGFALTISASGTVYYTLDGSDPRAVGGAVAGTAYTAPLELAQTTQVKARVLRDGEWSALTKATFVLDEASPLRVTEIMYHPASPTSGSETNFTATDFEFIELLNTGSEPIGLAGTTFSEGIHFDFTDAAVDTLDPGEYAILVRNYSAFTNRYANGASIPIAGVYHGKFFHPTGSLDNGGEDLLLVDGLGNTIQAFAYADWYEATDGEGFSLTLIDATAETSTWSVASSWRPSKYNGGTPGEAPVDFSAPGDLVINEALTHQDDDTTGDWIELYNASDNPLDLNGWFLSDDPDHPAKLELSGLPPIASGGYLVLTEASHFGTGVAGTNGFGLSELGDAICVSSAEDGALTGYRTDEAFGAADRDTPFGRFVKSDGTTDFTAQSAPSANAANAYPLIGDVVFAEILYHPTDNQGFEFIELYNPGPMSVPLYHPNDPASPWSLEGAVAFTFPEELVLDAGERILITETNRAAFTAHYTVDAGVTVLGPYAGRLDNAGETLLLTRPGDPEAQTGEVPRIVVERVAYTPEAPWPIAADGGGASLERVDAALYPNDAANWTANPTPSPGAGAPAAADADLDGMPDAWELAYFGATNAVNGEAEDDWDQDGSSNRDELDAGTIPTDPDSVFNVVSAVFAANGVLTWTSETGKQYSLWICTNLVSGTFTLRQSGIQATPPRNTFTMAADDPACSFYRLTVDDE